MEWSDQYELDAVGLFLSECTLRWMSVCVCVAGEHKDMRWRLSVLLCLTGKITLCLWKDNAAKRWFVLFTIELLIISHYGYYNEMIAGYIWFVVSQVSLVQKYRLACCTLNLQDDCCLFLVFLPSGKNKTNKNGVEQTKMSHEELSLFTPMRVWLSFYLCCKTITPPRIPAE